MDYVVIVYNHYIHAPTAIAGYFASKEEAQIWMEEKDYKLSKHESMAVHTITPSRLVLP